ncbi:MAG: hypothetical protein N3F07_01985 [Candidatus Micrarchaeota archaeon]|nr:hypothetical protein [Candidatus Micrarchaeota archaeon]
MRVLVFGNPAAKEDSSAVEIAKRLEGKMPGVEFVLFDTAEDLEKEGPAPVILDVVFGLKAPKIVRLGQLEKPANPISLHGFDLIWSLLLLKKIGKLRSATIIGVPPGSPSKSIAKVEKILRKVSARR